MEQAATQKELRILMLEDTPTDAELIAHELRKAGIVFTSLCVDTRDTFIRALEEFRPDVILSDYHLPNFDGGAALEVVRRDHPEIPVIMVTGALPDIEAVELIHAGARDYVLKDRLARLAPAVQRALSVEQGVRARKAAEAALARHARDLGERVKEMGCLRDITNLLLNKDRDMDQVLDACVRRIPAAWLDPSHTCARISLDGQAFESADFRETEWRLAAAISMSGVEHGLIEVFYFGEITGDGETPFLDEERSLMQSIATQITQSLESRLAEKVLRESEVRFRNLVETSNDWIWEVDEHSVYTYASPRIQAILGYKPAEIIGKAPFNLMSPAEAKRVAGRFEPLVSARQPIINFENTCLHKDGHPVILETSGVPIIGQDGKFFGYRGIDRDITERKQAEIALAHANRALATLGAVNRQLVHAADENELLQAICQIIVKQRGYRMAWVGYALPDADKTIQIMAHAGHEEGYLDTIQLTWAENEHGMGPSGRAIRSGATQLCQDIASDPQFSPWRNAALQRGYFASIALPLSNASGNVFGLLVVYAEEVNAFSPGEVGLLEEMAGDMAFGVNAMHLRQERDHALEQDQQHIKQLQDSLEDTVRAIAGIVEMRDPYTAGHQARVADLAVAIAKQMGLPDEQVHAIHLAGIVHDLGKIHIPSEILSKPGKISDIEFSLIKTHSQAGYDILKGIRFPWPIAQMVLQHHERMDGSGYPQGLKGDDILLGARILAVADVVEAMYSHRPYRPGLGLDAALTEITKQRAICFDPQVVDACSTLFREQHYSFNI